MTFTIKLNESDASLRAIPMWLVTSDGTSPATSEADEDIDMQIGGVFYSSVGSISAVSANQGAYVGVFNASVLSVGGPGEMLYGSTVAALDFSAPIQVIEADPYDDYLVSHGLKAQSGGAQDLRLNSAETTTNDFFNGSILLPRPTPTWAALVRCSSHPLQARPRRVPQEKSALPVVWQRTTTTTTPQSRSPRVRGWARRGKYPITRGPIRRPSSPRTGLLPQTRPRSS